MRCTTRGCDGLDVRVEEDYGIVEDLAMVVLRAHADRRHVAERDITGVAVDTRTGVEFELRLP